MIYSWGDLISLEYGKPVKDKAKTDGKYPVYGTNGQIGTSDIPPLCDHPSFILGRKGAYRGVHFSDVPFSVIDTAFYAENLHPELLDIKWAYYKFLTYDINSMDSGSAIPSTDRYEMYAIEVDLPSIQEQERTVRLLECFDSKIVVNGKTNENLQQQLRAIFTATLTENVAIESMRQVPLSELCSVITKGTTPTTLGKPFVDRGINFIKAESILDNHALDKKKFAHIDEETQNLLKRSVIQAGDIVFTIAGTLGRFAMIDSDILPANTNQAVAIIRADKTKITPEYLYCCFIGNWHNDYYTKRIQQAVQANLSLTTIKSLPIPILGEDEMTEYLQLITPIVALLKHNEKENERLISIRDCLLPKLMNGEIDVRSVNN